MGIYEDSAEVAALPHGVAPGALAGSYDVAQLVSVNTVTHRATISFRASVPFELPCLPFDYTGYTTVHVLCDPMAGGRAVLVLGPAGVQASPPVPPPPPAGQTAVATLLPTSSGTYRVDSGAWDRWNVGSYGGASDVYQGNGYGSGVLIGLACYGEQIVGLGAASITSAVLTLERNGSGGNAAVVVQGSPHGSRPAGGPSGAGDTAATGVLSATGKTTLALPAGTRESLRTGAAKGLVLVGSVYAGVFGTSRADGLALKLTYTRT